MASLIATALPALGALGGLAGAASAWFTWRTRRELKLLGEPWRITHFQIDAFILENRMPRTACAVELRFPPGTSLSGVEGDLGTMPPSGKAKILVFRSMGGGDLFEVEWRRRPNGKPSRRTLVLPAKAPAPVKVVQPRNGQPVY